MHHANIIFSRGLIKVTISKKNLTCVIAIWLWMLACYISYTCTHLVLLTSPSAFLWACTIPVYTSYDAFMREKKEKFKSHSIRECPSSWILGWDNICWAIFGDHKTNTAAMEHAKRIHSADIIDMASVKWSILPKLAECLLHITLKAPH